MTAQLAASPLLVIKLVLWAAAVVAATMLLRHRMVTPRRRHQVGPAPAARNRKTEHHDNEENPMNVKKPSDLPVMTNPHNVDARNLYNTEDAVITAITLQPGERLRRHITPVDVAFYVLEGTGVVEIGEEKREVAGDTLVESPRDLVHCWYNESGGVLRFLVIKAPRPKTKTTFLPD